jgi:hypothetical protein
MTLIRVALMVRDNRKKSAFVNLFYPRSNCPGKKAKKNPNFLIFSKLGFCIAEEEGFEPPVPHGTTVFKTAAIDHSATPLCLA